MASPASTATADSAAQPRLIQKFLLLWVDANVQSSNSDTQNTLKYLRTIVNDVKVLDKPDECLRILKDMPGKQSFVITSGAFGKELVPRIHDLPGLDAIYIFCGNKQYHEPWSSVWQKVKAVETNIKLIGEALQKAVKQTNQDDIAMSIIKVGNGSEADLNRLEPSFLYTSLLKDAILSMDHNLEEEMAIFKDSISKKSDEHGDGDAKVMAEFQTNYCSDQAIFWYTKETFIYQLMNGALRNLAGDTIVDMGFFIHNLHQQIDQLCEQQLSTFGSKQFVVYRGQGLPKEKFEQLKKSKGGLLGFNNFLSTSRNRGVSLEFATRGTDKPGNVGLLFVMTIDPKLKLTPFADVTAHTAVNGEEEILFSMHTIFRIGDIEQVPTTREIYEVQLVLTSEDDPQMKKLHDYMKGSIKATGWSRIGRILLDMNQLDKAEEIYRRLLVNETKEINQASWNHQLGLIKYKQSDYAEAKEFLQRALEIYSEVRSEDDGVLANTYSLLGTVYSNMADYSEALSNHERALAIEKKTLPDTHIDLAISYNNIGNVYSNLGDYPQALSNYERALAIEKKILPDTHINLAISYSNIGNVYSDMGDYPQALPNYERALAIEKETLPDTHSDLATSYNNIGSVYWNMGDYPQALLNHEQALAIRKKTLSETHPDLAISYSNIGLVYSKIGDYSQALSNHEQALAIRKKILQETHPSLATSYSNIGSVYSKMGDYPQALSNHEQALAIRKETLPDTHPDLGTSYHNIGCLYYKMDKYSTALEHFEKALSILIDALPASHPNIAACRQWIAITKEEINN